MAVLVVVESPRQSVWRSRKPGVWVIEIPIEVDDGSVPLDRMPKHAQRLREEGVLEGTRASLELILDCSQCTSLSVSGLSRRRRMRGSSLVAVLPKPMMSLKEDEV